VISIEPLAPRDALLLKAIRLRALRDAPTAFSSTFEKESALSDADWMERASQWSGERSITYLARDEGAPCAIAAAYIDRENPELAHLVSMWVAPTHRRLGLGEKLVKRILDWVRLKNVSTLTLLVTSNNDAAIKFYERLGFAMTGKTTPHVNDLSLGDCEMTRPISLFR
jgi:ribosomal protein S18 acetylase RimI-like enzyme